MKHIKISYKVLLIIILSGCMKSNKEDHFYLSKNLHALVEDYALRIESNKRICILLRELRLDTSKYLVYSSQEAMKTNNTMCFFGQTEIQNHKVYLGVINSNFHYFTSNPTEKTLQDYADLNDLHFYCTLTEDSILNVAYYP